MKSAITVVALSLSAVFSAAAVAASGHEGMDHGTMHGESAAAAGAMAEGTVKKVDKSAGKITIAHGPLENLGMPPMTMVFRAGEPAMLDQIKAGDKVRFSAERAGGVFTVKSIEIAQ